MFLNPLVSAALKGLAADLSPVVGEDFIYFVLKQFSESKCFN